jgi:hypothetical protein
VEIDYDEAKQKMAFEKSRWFNALTKKLASLIYVETV